MMGASAAKKQRVTEVMYYQPAFGAPVALPNIPFLRGHVKKIIARAASKPAGSIPRHVYANIVNQHDGWICTADVVKVLGHGATATQVCTALWESARRGDLFHYSKPGCSAWWHRKRFGMSMPKPPSIPDAARKQMRDFFVKNPGWHTYNAIADATGLSLDAARRHGMNMRAAGMMETRKISGSQFVECRLTAPKDVCE